jgi:RNA polymerase sigma-70 factor (ECF subfamily)
MNEPSQAFGNDRPKDRLLLVLLKRIAQKDESAMAEFYQQTQPLLKAYVRWRIRDLGAAEEVLQDIYCQVWLNVLDYQPQRGLPSNWLYMIARSRTFDTLRRSRRKQVAQTLEDFTNQTASQDGRSEEKGMWNRLRVQTYIQDLPSAHRKLILLAYFDGYCHSEIANEVGLPLGTVKSRIRRALTMMRALHADPSAQPF